MRYFVAGAANVDMLLGDQIIATAKTLVDSSITISVTSEEVRGGYGNKLFGKYYHDSAFNVALTDTMFKLEWLAFQTGSSIEQGGNLFTTESIVLGAGGSGTITNEPYDNPEFGTIGWYAVPSIDPENWTKIEFTGKNFTIPTIDDGTEVCVKYVAYFMGARQMVISSSFVPAEVRLVMTLPLFKGSVNDATASSQIGFAQIDVPRFQFDGNQELSLTASGTTTVPISGSALDNQRMDCAETGYYAIITESLTNAQWYDHVFALAINGGADIDLTVGGTETLDIIAMPKSGANFKAPVEDLVFESTDPATATVDATGLITGVAAGTTTVTITIAGKPSVETVANITVA